MKTLSEIIEDVQDGKRPEYDDLRYSVVALLALRHFAFNSLRKLAEQEREGKYNAKMFGLQWEAKERFNQFKAALAKPPKEYVGVSHDPDTEECQRMRQISKNILKKAMARVEANKTPPVT